MDDKHIEVMFPNGTTRTVYYADGKAYWFDDIGERHYIAVRHDHGLSVDDVRQILLDLKELVKNAKPGPDDEGW